MTQASEVLILGADGVGKTSLLYKLKLNKDVQTIHTIGFNVEEINYKDKIIRMWDIGEDVKKKNLLKQYMADSKCIIYVLNLADKERLDYYIEYFNSMLDQLKNYMNIPIIIFGNKFNDKAEFEPEEMLKKINFPPEITPPHILKGNVKTGEGLSDLLDYIYNNIEFSEEKKEKTEAEKENNENIEKKDEFKVKMFGLDDAGKTKILYILKLGTKVMTIPTIGFNVERIENESQEKNITIWDIGGNKMVRKLWKQYFCNTNGLIWVYDMSKKEKYEESQNELKSILNDPDIKSDIPLLIIANKSDLNKEGNSINDYINGIQDCLSNRPYFIKECNYDDLDSYKDGLDWLYNNMN